MVLRWQARQRQLEEERQREKERELELARQRIREQASSRTAHCPAHQTWEWLSSSRAPAHVWGRAVLVLLSWLVAS